MQNVKDTTGQFTTSLSSATDKLTGVEVPENIKDILKMITSETQKMMSYNSELESRLDQSSNMMGELKRDMERIRRQAITDGLTGLANRKAFDDQINRLCREGKKTGQSFSLVMMDIDHFKAFNDKYGHQVGDQVLRLVAMTLINEVKGQDMAWVWRSSTQLNHQKNLFAGQIWRCMRLKTKVVIKSVWRRRPMN